VFAGSSPNGAVADRGLFRIDFGFIGDVTAVAPSIDLHDPILYRLSFRYSRQSGMRAIVTEPLRRGKPPRWSEFDVASAFPHAVK
jgi:hypothetical protein